LVIRGRNNNDLIPRYRLAGKLLAVNGCFHNAKLRLPVLNGRCYLDGVADTRSYLDPRVGAPKTPPNAAAASNSQWYGSLELKGHRVSGY
jgi:hypothetical protein